MLLIEKLVVPFYMNLEKGLKYNHSVNGQETPGEPRRMLALEQLIEGTPRAAT